MLRCSHLLPLIKRYTHPNGATTIEKIHVIIDQHAKLAWNRLNIFPTPKAIAYVTRKTHVVELKLLYAVKFKRRFCLH